MRKRSRLRGPRQMRFRVCIYYCESNRFIHKTQTYAKNRTPVKLVICRYVFLPGSVIFAISVPFLKKARTWGDPNAPYEKGFARDADMTTTRFGRFAHFARVLMLLAARAQETLVQLKLVAEPRGP